MHDWLLAANHGTAAPVRPLPPILFSCVQALLLGSSVLALQD